MHGRKDVAATVSDDCTWKVWNLANGELLMSAEGHKDWVSGVDFHPTGSHLITSSADNTIKVDRVSNLVFRYGIFNIRAALIRLMNILNLSGLSNFMILAILLSVLQWILRLNYLI
jgi:WD40 repeat protein